MSINNDILDKVIAHAIEIERYKEAEVRRTVTFLNSQILRDVKEQIEKRLNSIATATRPTGLQSLKSLQRLENELDDILTAGYASLSAQTKEELLAFARLESTIATRQISTALPSGVNIRLNQATVGALRDAVTKRPFEGRILRDWYRDLERSARLNIKDQLNIGLSSGESTNQITRRLLNTNSGVFNNLRRNAATVARTAVKHTATQAKVETYKANSKYIKKIQWVSTLDKRTSLTCQSLDGQVFAVDKGPRPPAHHNCRSEVVPIVDGWEKFGLKNPPPRTRASLDGQVPDTIKYPDWLKKQPRATQNEVLGPTRAELFRQGKVGINNLVDQQNRPLDLAQVAKRNNLTKDDLAKALKEASL